MVLQRPGRRSRLDVSFTIKDLTVNFLANSYTALQLVTGRVWKGCAFGGVKGRSQMGGLVQDYTDGKLKIDEFITHRKALDQVNDGFRTMASGDCIRCVVDMA